MLELEGVGVEEKAPQLGFVAASVEGIADDWAPQGRKVCPDLVQHTGMDSNLDQSVFAGAPENLEGRTRGAGCCIAWRRRFYSVGMSRPVSQREVDFSFLRQRARHQRPIAFVHFLACEGAANPVPCRATARRQQNPRSADVQAMAKTAFPRIF